jgi:hypothetical protein
VCEIAGHGPVPIDTVADAVDGGAFVAALSMNGTEIDKVIHHGRRPTALQRTALKWETGGTCVVEGCTNAVRTEIDHVDPWASSKVTQLKDLAGPCKHCHDLKTHRGYTLSPRLPNGKRQLIPPGDTVDGHRPDRPPPRTDKAEPRADGPIRADSSDQAEQTDQVELFDTG